MNAPIVMFLGEGELERLWATTSPRETVWGSIRSFQEGESVIAPAHTQQTSDPRLVLLAGNLGLSSFDDDLSAAWTECLASRPRAFRVLKPADGAFGGYLQATQDAYRDFRMLAGTLLDRLGIARRT